MKDLTTMFEQEPSLSSSLIDEGYSEGESLYIAQEVLKGNDIDTVISMLYTLNS